MGHPSCVCGHRLARPNSSDPSSRRFTVPGGALLSLRLDGTGRCPSPAHLSLTLRLLLSYPSVCFNHGSSCPGNNPFRSHHLVEISTPPFHLTRRGWGEFPLKLKIHF